MTNENRNGERYSRRAGSVALDLRLLPVSLGISPVPREDAKSRTLAHRKSAPGPTTMTASTSGNEMQDYDVRLVTLTIEDR